MAILTAPVAADTATTAQHEDCGANTAPGNTDVVLAAALEASSRAQRALTAAQQVSKELRAVEMLAACGVATVVFGVVPSFLQCVFLLLVRAGRWFRLPPVCLFGALPTQRL